jgi:hypothetical protein
MVSAWQLLLMQPTQTYDMAFRFHPRLFCQSGKLRRDRSCSKRDNGSHVGRWSETRLGIVHKLDRGQLVQKLRWQWVSQVASIEHYLGAHVPSLRCILPGETQPRIETNPGPWMAIWQGYPIVNFPLTNANLLRGLTAGDVFHLVNATHKLAITFTKIYQTTESQLQKPRPRTLRTFWHKARPSWLWRTFVTKLQNRWSQSHFLWVWEPPQLQVHHKRDGDTWVPRYPIWAPPRCAIY